MIKIRTAIVKDNEMLAALGRKAFFEAFGAYSDPADMQAYLNLAFNPDTIELQLSDPEVTYVVALFNDEPVGYAKLKRNSSVPELKGLKVIQLERIYALRDFIGKKVGKTLMQECVNISIKEGFVRLWLSVWQKNEVAIRFYEKWGFETIGFKQFVIGKEVNDDFVMALKLA